MVGTELLKTFVIFMFQSVKHYTCKIWIIQVIPLIVVLDTGAVPNIRPEFSETYRDSRRAEGHDKRDTTYNCC